MYPRKAQKYYPDELKYMKDNFYDMPKQTLLDNLNRNRSASNPITMAQIRHQLRRMGLVRMKQIRWTKTQIKFLKKHYKTKGDVEIARLLNETKSRSKKVFTRKNVCKKRGLMGWNRTPEQIKEIMRTNNNPGQFKKGRNSDMALKEGDRTIVKATDGSKREMIKYQGKLITYARYRIQRIERELLPGECAYHKDMDSLNNNDENLYIRRRGTLSLTEYLTAKPLIQKRIDALVKKIAKADRSEGMKLNWELSRLSELMYKVQCQIKKMKKYGI